MLPDHAGCEPVEDLAADVDRIGKEERRQQHAAEERHGGEQLPQPQRDGGDQKLAEAERQSRHGRGPLDSPPPCGEGSGVPSVPILTYRPPQPSPIASRACPTCARFKCATGANPGCVGEGADCPRGEYTLKNADGDIKRPPPALATIGRNPSSLRLSARSRFRGAARENPLPCGPPKYRAGAKAARASRR